MSDPITLSKSARESLSRGLNALQADPTVPAQLVELAAPIAQAMGALHQLERNNQLAPHADVALNHVRGALAQLQAAPPNHPAVNAALDAVAKSLTIVHSLSRMAAGGAPIQPTAKPEPPRPPPATPGNPRTIPQPLPAAGQPPPAPRPPTAPQPVQAPRPPTAPQPMPAPAQPSFSASPAQPSFSASPAQPSFSALPAQPAFSASPLQPSFSPGLAPTVAAAPGASQAVPLRPPIPAGFASTSPIANRPPSQPGFSQQPQQPPQQQQHQPPRQQPPPQHQPPRQQPPPQQQQQPPPQHAMVARDPFAAPARDPFAPQPATGAKPATPSIPVPAPPPVGGMQLFPADLGAHSPTNFYKGLSGNDIIDHGGLFVSTYLYPKIGTQVRLKISLPGGYEFEANAVVKWTREQGGDAPPGFGARFTGITNEARQLIYRYVRNREPLFYDDL